VTAPTQLAVLCGFDRSGSSMVARLVARHPEVECLFQPDNGTVLHRTQWERWAPEHRDAEAERFFAELIAGRLDRSFIRSDWFANHSSTTAIVPGRLHIVKSTKLHLKVDWLAARFPELPLFALVRDPMATLASLVDNDFHRTWYGARDFEALCALVASSPELPAPLRAAVLAADDDVSRMAAMIAVRTRLLVDAVPAARVLHHERIVADPDGELCRLVGHFGRPPFGFAAHAGEDFNVVGKPFGRPATARAGRSWQAAAELFALADLPVAGSAP
jgi:hypothetical protein